MDANLKFKEVRLLDIFRWFTPKGPVRSHGYFTRRDPRTRGIRYSNWGSRPQEYYWISNVVPAQGKRIIDIGTGIPSQYGWPEYVRRKLKPSYYFGIDHDERIKPQEIHECDFVLQRMDMNQIQAESGSFDLGYCISVLEHVPLSVLEKGIREVHRVLKKDAKFLITLDEIWDINGTDPDWNILERDLIKENKFVRSGKSFGLKEFVQLFQAYFVLDDVSSLLPDKSNAQQELLHHEFWNSCVSYAVLKKA